MFPLERNQARVDCSLSGGTGSSLGATLVVQTDPVEPYFRFHDDAQQSALTTVLFLRRHRCVVDNVTVNLRHDRTNNSQLTANIQGANAASAAYAAALCSSTSAGCHAVKLRQSDRLSSLSFHLQTRVTLTWHTS